MNISIYHQLEYFPDKSLLTITWTTQTMNMTEDDFKQVLLEILAFIKKNKVEWYLADTQEFKFSIIPEVQDWTNTHFLPQIFELGVKKMAIIVSEDLFSQVSIEQVLEDNQSGMQSAYFKTTDEALQWLK